MSYRAIDISGETPRDPGDLAPPQLRWLPISALVVDERYQRPLLDNNWKAIRRIADAFDWAKFSPVLVAPIGTDQFAIIDGQHRVHAAALCGRREVPAMVVQVPLTGQAAAFAAVNGAITGVSQFHLLRAALAAGDQTALEMDRAVRAAGCDLMTAQYSAKAKKPGQIFCPQLVRLYVTKGQGDVVTLALSALRRAAISANATIWSDYVLRPWCAAIAARPGLTGDELIAFLRVRDLWKILDWAEKRKRDDPAVAGKTLGALQRDAILEVLPKPTLRAKERAA